MEVPAKYIEGYGLHFTLSAEFGRLTSFVINCVFYKHKTPFTISIATKFT